jgi:hypothetical protein
MAFTTFQVLTAAAVAVLFAAHHAGSAATREIILNAGAPGAKVIGPALDRAPAGSVVRLRKGVYREIVEITRPVSLIGDEGTVIDPAEPFRGEWKPAPEFGPGVYTAAVERAPAAPAFTAGDQLAGGPSTVNRDASPKRGAAWQPVVVNGRVCHQCR